MFKKSVDIKTTLDDEKLENIKITLRKIHYIGMYYTLEEINQLGKWIFESGDNFIIVQNHTGLWTGYHILDYQRTIDIGTDIKEDLIKKFKLYSFTIVEEIPIHKEI